MRCALVCRDYVFTHGADWSKLHFMAGDYFLKGTALLVSMLMSGCAAVTPLASALTGTAPVGSIAIQTQTTVRLESGNFVTVRTNVTGQSKGFKLLGLITFRPATLDTALNQLYANAEVDVGRPQTLAHLIVEQSAVYVILFSIPKVTARADLIEFLPVREEDEEPPGSNPEIHRVRHVSKPF